MSDHNAAIAAYLREWADDLNREVKQATDMYGPRFIYGKPAPDYAANLTRKSSTAFELRRRADLLDPPCVVCSTTGGHDDWCRPEWRPIPAEATS